MSSHAFHQWGPNEATSPSPHSVYVICIIFMCAEKKLILWSSCRKSFKSARIGPHWKSCIRQICRENEDLAHLDVLHTSRVLKSDLVWFFCLIWAQPDCDQSFYFLKIIRPQPNPYQPVACGCIHQLQPVMTSFGLLMPWYGNCVMCNKTLLACTQDSTAHATLSSHSCPLACPHAHLHAHKPHMISHTPICTQLIHNRSIHTHPHPSAPIHMQAINHRSCHDHDIPPSPVHPQLHLHTALFTLDSPWPNPIYTWTLSPPVLAFACTLRHLRCLCNHAWCAAIPLCLTQTLLTNCEHSQPNANHGTCSKACTSEHNS